MCGARSVVAKIWYTFTMQEIKLVVPKPEDTWAITEVFYKSWLLAYPNEKYGITVDDIEDRFKIAFSPEDQ
jgi:hypothetical protein